MRSTSLSQLGSNQFAPSCRILALFLVTSVIPTVRLIWAQEPEASLNAISDQIARLWDSHGKFYLIITATQAKKRHSKKPSTYFEPLPWVDDDGKQMEEFLRRFHYQPLRDPLKGDDVNYQEVEAALSSIHNGHSQGDVIVVYFSGHGQRAGKDVNLILNDGSKMKLSEWVRLARGETSTGQPSYKGELVFLLDACDSGNFERSTFQYDAPTIILGASSGNEKARKLESAGISAFTSVLVSAFSTDWDLADENQDGFLEYSELEKFVQVKLKELSDAHKIAGEMHPSMAGEMTKPMFIAYDKSKDRKPGSLMERIFAGKDVISQLLSESAIINFGGDTPQIQSVAKHLASWVSRQPDYDKLPLLARGYTALAEGEFDRARQFFEAVKTETPVSQYEIARAEEGLARTEMFSGNFTQAVQHYEIAGAYFDDGWLLSENGAATWLTGQHGRSIDMFLKASELNISRQRRTGIVGVMAFVTIPLGFGKKETVMSPALDLAVNKNLAVACTVAGKSKSAEKAVDHLLEAANKLSKSSSSEDVRIAAGGYAKTADVRGAQGKRSDALKLYKKASVLFDQVDDKSEDHQRMLENYAAALKDAHKSELAEIQLRKLAAIRDSEVKIN